MNRGLGLKRRRRRSNESIEVIGETIIIGNSEEPGNLTPKLKFDKNESETCEKDVRELSNWRKSKGKGRFVPQSFESIADQKSEISTLYDILEGTSSSSTPRIIRPFSFSATKTPDDTKLAIRNAQMEEDEKYIIQCLLFRLARQIQDEDERLAKQIQEQEYTAYQPTEINDNHLEYMLQAMGETISREQLSILLSDGISGNLNSYDVGLDMTYEGLLELGERIGDVKKKKKLSETSINALPIRSFKFQEESA